MLKGTISKVQSAWLCLAATLFGGTVGSLSILILRELASKPVTTAPEIAGQPAPATVREVDFLKRYDFHCTFKGEPETTVFRNCQIVGFTGRDDEAGGGKFSYKTYFERWIILEQSDRRQLVIPPDSIRYFESTKGP